MTAEEQELKRQRLREADLMPQIVRAEKADDLTLARLVIQWDDDDIHFVRQTRLGRAVMDRFGAIPHEQIREWDQGGELWEQ